MIAKQQSQGIFYDSMSSIPRSRTSDVEVHVQMNRHASCLCHVAKSCERTKEGNNEWNES